MSARRCTTCQTPLSRYNPEQQCVPCQTQGRRRHKGCLKEIPPELRGSLREPLAAGAWSTVLSMLIAAGLTQTEIAARTGLSQAHISRLASGRSRTPTIATIRALCDGLGIPRWMAGLADARPEEDTTKRRTLLGGALGAAVAGATAAAGREAPVDTQLLTVTTTAYRRMEQSTPSRPLIGAVAAHLSLVRQLAARSQAAERSLHSVVSETAGLAAWIYADLDDTANARRCYRLAVTAAQRSGHPLLPAYMIASMGQYAVSIGDAAPGLRLIRQARASLPKGAPSVALAWLDTMEAVALAWMADRSAMPLLDQAERRLSGWHDTVWPWVFRFDEARVTAYRALAASRLGLIRTAEAAFQVTADIPQSPKQRILATIEHARALAKAGQIDAACHHATMAYDIARQIGSERGVRTVTRWRSELGSIGVPNLDNRLNALYEEDP